MGKGEFGSYHRDPEGYEQLITCIYAQRPPLELPSEYARAFASDLVMLTVRLARYKFIARVLRKTDRVLEVGCGYGLGCAFLSQHVKEVRGIDVQECAIGEARRLVTASNVEFETCDFFDFHSEKKFDVVVASDVIEHLTIEQCEEFVQRTAVLVVPAGVVVIGTPSVWSLPYQSEVSRLSHVHCWDREELLAVLDRSFGRVFPFSMNDEIVGTGHPKMAWFYFFLCTVPR